MPPLFLVLLYNDGEFLNTLITTNIYALAITCIARNTGLRRQLAFGD
jgi:hypothetical protein